MQPKHAGQRDSAGQTRGSAKFCKHGKVCKTLHDGIFTPPIRRLRTLFHPAHNSHKAFYYLSGQVRW